MLILKRGKCLRDAGRIELLLLPSLHHDLPRVCWPESHVLDVSDRMQDEASFNSSRFAGILMVTLDSFKMCKCTGTALSC